MTMFWIKIFIKPFKESQACDLCTKTSMTCDQHVDAKSEYLIFLLDIFLISSDNLIINIDFNRVFFCSFNKVVGLSA